jgi:acyl-[acyl-carrier-protein] desaturase
MSQLLSPENPALKKALYETFRDFFGRAERKRRWSLRDIPWSKARPRVNPAIASVVESFCVVELYLPDYVAKALPMIRTNRGWSSFHINWGYEESKHSLALGDWLVWSGARTREQLIDLEGQVFQKEWTPPQDSGEAMLIYAMCQELATWLHYRKLREFADVKSDPALSRVLDLIAIDERAHHNFYRRIVQVFLELDRAATLEHLRRILHTFAMPAVHLLADSQKRAAEIRSMNIFNEEIFYAEIYLPILDILGISRAELRNRLPNMKGRTART